MEAAKCQYFSDHRWWSTDVFDDNYGLVVSCSICKLLMNLRGNVLLVVINPSWRLEGVSAWVDRKLVGQS
jgi:hypothetical protein